MRSWRLFNNFLNASSTYLGQATGEERNIAVMLDIARSVSNLFLNSVDPAQDSTNAGRLIITRKPKPSANSSSAPDA